MLKAKPILRVEDIKAGLYTRAYVNVYRQKRVELVDVKGKPFKCVSGEWQVIGKRKHHDYSGYVGDLTGVYPSDSDYRGYVQDLTGVYSGDSDYEAGVSTCRLFKFKPLVHRELKAAAALPGVDLFLSMLLGRPPTYEELRWLKTVYFYSMGDRDIH